MHSTFCYKRFSSKNANVNVDSLYHSWLHQINPDTGRANRDGEYFLRNCQIRIITPTPNKSFREVDRPE